MNNVEFLSSCIDLQQIMLNTKLLDMIPGGFSISTDASCTNILYNTTAAGFLHVEPWQRISSGRQDLPQIFHAGQPLLDGQLPLQRAALYGEVIEKLELEYVWADGETKVAQWSARPLRDDQGKINGAIAMLVDVTDMVLRLRKLADATRKLENGPKDDAKVLEERFQSAIDLLPSGLGLLSPIKNVDGKVVDFVIDYVNEAHCKRAKMTKEQLIGLRLSQTFQNNQLLEAYCNVEETGRPLESNPVYYSDDANNVLDFACEGHAVKIAHGIATFWHDVTERKQSEFSLKQSEERFSKAFYYSPYMKSIITVADNKFLYVNDAFLQGYNCTANEVIGKTPFDLGATPEKLAQFLSAIQREGVVRDLEVRINRKNRDYLDGLLSAVRIVLDGQDCILCEYYNITDIKRTQAEMARLDRLNLVGQLAAGIGHEVRNPMTTVRGYLQLFEQKPEFAKHTLAFDLMISELDRANFILTQFLSVARNQVTQTTRQNLNNVLKNILPLVEASALNQNKQVDFLADEIPDIELNVKEINQLFLNLCQNGLESMPEQGRLKVLTYMEDNHVVLSVKDEGCGIAKEHLGNLGTPFFTTKDTGTGLGLATCYSIAARHHAHIDVETGLQGTTFLVRFNL